ncbi:MAG: hypothetical protein U0694_22035 [Anaerolineae bacterium]
MPDEPPRYHVVLYQVIKTPHDTPVAARIERYAEGEQPQTVWSTLSAVDTQLNFVYGAVLQIIGSINDNLTAILTELERGGWYVVTEAENDHQHDPQTIYRSTHFVLLRRGIDA